MCTLTFLPQTETAFLLTSNRDESPMRARALAPAYRTIGQREVLFPVDGKAGGTWIVTANDRRTSVLLNGAFQPHAMGGTYRLSRGIMVLESFEFRDVADFAASYDFEGIEPFTYVDIQRGTEGLAIHEIRWDGTDLYHKDYDAEQPQIWSSAQLYLAEVIEKREIWFHKWIEAHPSYGLADIQKFHRFGGEGDVYNDIRMNRSNLVKTVSTTAIENHSQEITMHYEDLLSGESVRHGLGVL